MIMQDPEPQNAQEAQPVPSTPNHEENPAKEEAVAQQPVKEEPAPATEEPAVEEEPVAQEETTAEDTAMRKVPSKTELLARAVALLDEDAAKISRDEVSRLRGLYALAVEAEAAKVMARVNAAATEQDEKPALTAEEQQILAGETEGDREFRTVLENIKAKRAQFVSAQEEQRRQNLERKNAIIQAIEALAGDIDNATVNYQRFRDLQTEFNNAGEVPPTEETAVWKRFQAVREVFLDNHRICRELRDNDFAKSLEEKTALIEKAVALTTHPDVVEALQQLQQLQAAWRAIGPVAKELRDEVWTKFREPAQEILRRHQTFFEERKAREAQNEAGKTAICERIEAIDINALSTYRQWDEATEKIKAAQEEWKTLGYASRKMNNALFSRFRATCDTFFTLKAAFYKQAKDTMAQNLAAKNALADEAEALKDSTDWKKTTDRMVAMQKEWKTIGAATKKHSDAVWKRFQTACDYFFEQKKAANSGQRRIENENLQAKRDLIAELDTITEETPKADARALINDLQERWKSIGHVPFREKEAVYRQFRDRIDAIRKQFDISARRENMQRFQNTVAGMQGDSGKLSRERERLARLLESRRNELRTYENNLGFLNAKSKSGNSLMRDFENKIERLKADIAALRDKLKMIDAGN